MPVQVLGETKRKLDHVPERLRDEFEDVDPGAVEGEVLAISNVLLENASFPDFVPLLTYRYAREHLLDVVFQRGAPHSAGASALPSRRF